MDNEKNCGSIGTRFDSMGRHTINLLNSKEYDSMRNLNSNALEISGRRDNRPLPAEGAALRVGLRLWGFAESEVDAWTPGLPVFDGLLSWEIARHRDGDGAGMIIHLVKSSSRALGSFCWNCVGANEAIRASANTSRVEAALFCGDESRLPAVRSGFWAMAGTRPAEAALHTLAHAVIVPRLMRERARQRDSVIRVVPRRLASS
ncbi:hypothetical protein RI103_09850 [Paraburkholderia sp. FT54]|uniref:hypothetical protein n=1 Tax=Paraburkholderia sp. FT54 TaxID=3074437 RepID=UPI00287756CA|nr:hypothetical protein [Paraburkholderia sp. FT54]WNC91623.1 hypothetical protein RI103_09850 [Paraburkholderia sp. FT54]